MEQVQIEENPYQEQPYRVNPVRILYTRARRKSEKIFKETFGAEIDVDEIGDQFAQIDAMEEIANTEVKQPGFPIFTFYIALVLDLLDFVQLTGVGWFVMVVINIVFTIILFSLMFRKLDTTFTVGSKFLFRGKGLRGSRRGGKSRAERGLSKFAINYLKKYMSRRLLATLVINIIPFVGILASNAFFVFLAHNKHKKIAQKYMYLVEAVGKVLSEFERKAR